MRLILLLLRGVQVEGGGFVLERAVSKVCIEGGIYRNKRLVEMIVTFVVVT